MKHGYLAVSSQSKILQSIYIIIYYYFTYIISYFLAHSSPVTLVLSQRLTFALYSSHGTKLRTYLSSVALSGLGAA
jgi:hypothetical protein